MQGEVILSCTWCSINILLCLALDFLLRITLFDFNILTFLDLREADILPLLATNYLITT